MVSSAAAMDPNEPQSCETCTGSSSGGMSDNAHGELEIPVWIGGCEKWVTGLTKRTTCDDVIYALLCHDNNPNESVDVQNYAIHERWREMERPLRGRTKILKVWRAWGAEGHNVRFYMRKVENVLDESCEVSSIRSFTRKPRRQNNCHPQREAERERRSRGRENENRARGRTRDPSHRLTDPVRGPSNNKESDKYSNSANHRDSTPANDRELQRQRRSSSNRFPSNHRDSSINRDSSTHRDPSNPSNRELSNQKASSNPRDSSRPRDSSSHREQNRYQSVNGHISDQRHPSLEDSHLLQSLGEERPTRSRSQDRRSSEQNRLENRQTSSKSPPANTDDTSKSQAFHQLVQIILEQEKKLQEQVTRMHETDIKIESYETKMHMLRMKENGQNYVQEAYLRDKSDESSASSEELFPHVKSVDLDAYLHICENILEMQDRISEQENKVHDLSISVMEESFLQSPQAAQTGNSNWSSNSTHEEVEFFRHEIGRCDEANYSQKEQLESLDETICDCENQIQLKMDYFCKLQQEIDQLELSDSEELELVATQNGGSVKESKENLSQPVVQFCDNLITQAVTNKLNPAVTNSISNQKPRGILKDTQAKYESNSAHDQAGNGKDNGYTITNGRTMIPYFTYATYHDPYLTSSPTGTKHNLSDDSDTGLSSLHSDDPPPVLETLV